MNKNYRIIVLCFILVFGIMIGFFFFKRDNNQDSDNFMLSTRVYHSGFFECSSKDYEPSFKFQPKEIKIGEVLPTDFKNDNSKDPFASPKYIGFIEEKYFDEKREKEIIESHKQMIQNDDGDTENAEDEELEVETESEAKDEDDYSYYYDEEDTYDVMTVSFDYGNGFSLFDDTNKTNFEYFYCYDRYSYDDKTKNITLYRTNVNEDCKSAPSIYQIRLVNFYEQGDVAHLTLSINNKEYKFASIIHEVLEKTIDLSGEYRNAYICESSRKQEIMEIIHLYDNNTGEFILMVDQKLKKQIPIKYRTIERDGETLVIVYSTQSGIYFELDIDEDSLGNVNYGSYYKMN